MSTTAKSLNILLLEPFYGGSHKLWADGLRKHSSHKILISTLPDRHWKWRMHGSAVTFAERHKNDIHQYDLVVVTDLCDVAALKGLLHIEAPVILYFHENQLAYPWSPTDVDVSLKRDRHYMWINFTSALAADYCWFNSDYNKRSFLDGLISYLKAFPDHRKFNIQSIADKSMVVPLGLDLKPFYQEREEHHHPGSPHILWNHRWEYDKGPELFFNTLKEIKEEGIVFQLSVIGTRGKEIPEVFNHISEWFKKELIQCGPVETREQYVQVLKNADIIPVTSNQDFFGISVIEAIAAGCIPILPLRLAYPEHFPSERDKVLFYGDDREFKEKLAMMISQFPGINLAQRVHKYDWTSRIKEYDDLFTSIYTQGKC